MESCPQGGKFFFRKIKFFYDIGLRDRKSFGFSKVFFGVSRILCVVSSPEDFFAAVFPLSHYLKFLNKTKHTHTHTHTHTNVLLRGSKVLGVVPLPEDFFAAVFSFVPLLEVS